MLPRSHLPKMVYRMSYDKFHQRFNLNLDIEEAKRRFVNRAHNFIIHGLPGKLSPWGVEHINNLEKFICTKLGERYTGIYCLSSILGNDFLVHLRALEALFKNADTKESTDEAAKSFINDSELDLGLRWQNGQFIASGSPLLDEKLVNDVLALLTNSNHKAVLDSFVNGLSHFLHSLKNPSLLSDVVTNMHKSLEALAQNVNTNDKDLSANREAFVANLKLSEAYKRMLKEYIQYANDFACHAAKRGEAKPAPSRREVEAFIYQTGIFLRLALSEEK